MEKEIYGARTFSEEKKIDGVGTFLNRKKHCMVPVPVNFTPSLNEKPELDSFRPNCFQ